MRKYIRIGHSSFERATGITPPQPGCSAMRLGVYFARRAAWTLRAGEHSERAKCALKTTLRKLAKGQLFWAECGERLYLADRDLTCAVPSCKMNVCIHWNGRVARCPEHANQETKRSKRRHTLRDWAVKAAQNSRCRAVLKNITFELSPQLIKVLFEQQSGRCALSGVKLHVARHDGHHRGILSTSATVDRITRRGYTPDNVRILCYAVNSGLQKMRDCVACFRWLRACTTILNKLRETSARRIIRSALSCASPETLRLLQESLNEEQTRRSSAQ